MGRQCVQPCCKQLNKINLGNAAEEGLRALWRGAAYTRLRGGFNRKRYGETMHPVCRHCLGMPEDAAAQATSVEEVAAPPNSRRYIDLLPVG